MEERKFNGKKSFDKGGKKPFNKDRKSFDKGDRKPFNKDKGFNKDRKFNDKGGNRSFNKDRKPFDKKEQVEEVKNVDTSVRYYAYLCLYKVYVEKAYSNIEIDHVIRENKINELDAKLLTNIVYGTLSHERLLNWEIKHLCEKTPKEQARIILLMSLYQKRFLDRIPEFAIINEAVAVAKKVGGDAMGNFVNAILRESQRQNLEFNKEDCKDEYEYLSIAYNMPVWVIKMWETHYGKEKTLNLLKANLQEAPLSTRVNIHKANKELIKENPDFIDGNLAKNSLIYTGSTPIAQTEVMKKGLVSVQDESSQYVVEVLDPQENDKVLDMCAAPGSKTQYISELMNNTGKVLALDIHPHRVEIMKKYLTNLQLTNVTCVCYDSTKLHEKSKLVGSFDKVLLDAPCLGLGVIRRKPDIALSLQGEKLDEIVLLQAKLLEEAYLMLKDGGTLLYSTCSINKKENDAQIMAFLGKHKDMKRVFEKQIFPFDYNSDGFYICKLVKE